jgi:quinol monooxygenase YgiN
MIHVVATITVRPGTRERFLEHFKRMMPETQAERGCILYEPLIDCDGGIHQRQVPPRPEVVTIVEQWQDVEALRAHLSAPHMAAYRERVADYVYSASLQILRPA